MKEQQAQSTARTLHCIALTFKPPASAETLKVVGELFSHKACFAFLEDINHNYWAPKPIPIDIWLNT